MRKIPYVISFVAVLVSFVLSFTSFEIPEWVHVQSPPNFPLVQSVKWGLYQRCERITINGPDGTLYSEYSCREFPTQKSRDCQQEIDHFCVLWQTAGYSAQLGLILAAAALVSLLVVTTGFSTRARRRTAWQGIVALTSLHGALQMVTTAIIVHLYRGSNQLLGQGKLSFSFYLCTLSWCLDVFIIGGLLYTAFSAKAGKRWATGRTGYLPIPG